MGFQVMPKGQKYRQLLGLLTIALTLVGCGGGSSSGSSSPEVDLQTYSGTVSKGTIVGGQVSVYAISDNKEVSTTPLAQAETNHWGQFSVSLSNMPQQVLIKITGRETSSWMLCDLIDCGETTRNDWDSNANGRVDYGEQMTLDESFQISAYHFDWSTSKTINVNLMTHLAASSFPQPPSREQLSERYTEMQAFLGLSKNPPDLPPFSQQLANTGDESFLDVVLMLSLLPPASGHFSNLSNALNELTSRFSVTGQLDKTLGVSLTTTTRNALVLARRITPQQSAVINKLKIRSENAAASEGLVPADERPLLPPLI